MNALANMGANMSAMLSGNSPLTESQSDNAEGAEIGAVEMPQSSVPVNPSVTDSTEEAPMQSAEGNGGVETPPPSVSEEESEKDPPTPVEVNIDIDKTQGNAIYSSLLGVQNTLDNFQLDVNVHFNRCGWGLFRPFLTHRRGWCFNTPIALFTFSILP